jgi:hypothetical protein
MPPPKFCSSWGKATFAIVLSKACIAVAIIRAIAACLRLEFESMMTSTATRSYRTSCSASGGVDLRRVASITRLALDRCCVSPGPPGSSAR